MSVPTDVKSDVMAERTGSCQEFDARQERQPVQALARNQGCSGPKQECIDALASHAASRSVATGLARQPLQTVPEPRSQWRSDPCGQRTSRGRFSGEPSMPPGVLSYLSVSTSQRFLERRSSSPSWSLDHATEGRRPDGSSGSLRGRWRSPNHSSGARDEALRRDA
jgi:hypothetical protein